MDPVTASASVALTNAFERFDRASGRLLDAVSGASDADAGSAVADQVEAKVQAQAAVGMLRFSDEMFKALLDIQS